MGSATFFFCGALEIKKNLHYLFAESTYTFDLNNSYLLYLYAPKKYQAYKLYVNENFLG